MRLTWQAWAWIGGFATVSAALGWFVGHETSTLSGVFTGVVVFVMLIAASLLWLGEAMNTDI